MGSAAQGGAALNQRAAKATLGVHLLVMGTETGVLPVMDEVKKEAKRRHIDLLMLPTAEAIEALRKNPHHLLRSPLTGSILLGLSLR